MWKYHCFNRTRLLWPTAQVWINHYCIWCARFHLRNYGKLYRIFSCLLLIRNHMIFLMQSGINKKRISRALRTRAILSIFEKIYLSLTHSKLHSKSCDYRYKEIKEKLYHLFMHWWILGRKTSMKVDLIPFSTTTKMTGASFYLNFSIKQPRYVNRKIGT